MGSSVPAKERVAGGTGRDSEDAPTDSASDRVTMARLPAMRVAMHLPRAAPRPPSVPPAIGKGGDGSHSTTGRTGKLAIANNKMSKKKRGYRARRPRGRKRVGRQKGSAETDVAASAASTTEGDSDLRVEVGALRERLQQLERAAAGRAEMVARLTGRSRLLPTRRALERKIEARHRQADAVRAEVNMHTAEQRTGEGKGSKGGRRKEFEK